MLDRKCQNTLLKQKVGQKSAWDLCLNTFTPPTQGLKTSSRIPQQYKGCEPLSNSQTHVQIWCDTRSQQVPEHNSCCCCDSPALRLPWGVWCQCWFGFIVHPLLNFCKVCYGRNQTWQWKSWREVTIREEGELVFWYFTFYSGMCMIFNLFPGGIDSSC